jgi:hypothetical protein
MGDGSVIYISEYTPEIGPVGFVAGSKIPPSGTPFREPPPKPIQAQFQLGYDFASCRRAIVDLGARWTRPSGVPSYPAGCMSSRLRAQFEPNADCNSVEHRLTRLTGTLVPVQCTLRRPRLCSRRSNAQG